MSRVARNDFFLKIFKTVVQKIAIRLLLELLVDSVLIFLLTRIDAIFANLLVSFNCKFQNL